MRSNLHRCVCALLGASIRISEHPIASVEHDTLIADFDFCVTKTLQYMHGQVPGSLVVHAAPKDCCYLQQLMLELSHLRNVRTRRA